MFLNVLDWKKCYKIKFPKVRMVICIVLNFILAATYKTIKDFAFDCSYEEWLKVFSVVLICWLFLKELSFSLLGIKRNIISMVFILLAYLFYFSHIFLLAINYDYGIHGNDFAVVRYGEDIYIQSMNAITNLVMTLYYGLLAASMIKPKIRLKEVVKTVKINTLYVGTLIIFMTIPFFVHGAIRFLFYVASYGYAYAINNAGYDINAYAFMRTSLCGFVLCMISCKEERKAKRILSIAVIVYFLAMFSGQRAYNLMFLLLLFFIYFIVYKDMRLSFKMLQFVFVFAFILIETINLVRNTRAEGMNMSLLLQNLASDSLHPILDLLRELGITENAIVYTYMNQSEPVLGMQFMTSFLIAVPGMAKFFPNIDFSLLNVTDALDMWNFGGALISDIIFDFGENAYWACFLIGICLQMFFGFFLDTIYTRKCILGAFLSPILCEILFCIRSTTYKIPRLIILYVFFFFFYIGIYGVIQLCSLINWKESYRS